MPAPLVLEDLSRFVVPTELALAPDGRRLLVTVQQHDAAANEKRSALWLVDLAAPDTAPQRFTAGPRDRQPAWSPDGRWVAFVSDREAGPQAWVMPADGGEARRVTSMRYGAALPVWSPDGRRLLFTAEVRDDERDPVLRDSEPATDDKADRLRHVTRLQYRWDGSDLSQGREHLWLVEVADLLTGGAAPDPRQVTGGDYDHADAAWSPDGQRIAFVSDRSADRDANITTDIWTLDIASGDLTRLSDGNCEVSRPAWSPDGSLLAWFSMPYPPGHSISSVHIRVAERSPAGAWSHPRDIMARRDLRVGDGPGTDLARLRPAAPTWDAEGAGLYATVNERGTVNLWWFPLADRDPARVTTGAWGVGPFALVPGGERCAAVVAAPDRPPSLALFRLDTPAAPERWLANFNPWLAGRSVSLPERFDFFTADNWWLEGWILWPPERDQPEHAGKRWPVVVQIHGGPHGFYGPAYHAHMQCFAGAGYAVVFVNPRGSVGYGEHFARACDHDWGGGDYQDIMAGLDAALARHPDRLDPQRLAVTGTSYGGYMTNWIISHTSRFGAAVTINSVSNLLSCFGTGDIDATFGIAEYGGTPWERMAYYLERSPVTHAPRVTTPTRIIGAERDWRCPIGQSEEWFTALKFLGRAEVDFLRVPGASHSILTGSPRQFVAQGRAIQEWIERFVPAGPR